MYRIEHVHKHSRSHNTTEPCVTYDESARSGETTNKLKHQLVQLSYTRMSHAQTSMHTNTTHSFSTSLTRHRLGLRVLGYAQIVKHHVEHISMLHNIDMHQHTYTCMHSYVPRRVRRVDWVAESNLATRPAIVSCTTINISISQTQVFDISNLPCMERGVFVHLGRVTRHHSRRHTHQSNQLLHQLC